MNFTPNRFFDLHHFRYAELFSDLQHVWEVLARIRPFLQSFALGQIKTAVPDSAYLVHPALINIGKDVLIEPGAYIQGPCIIGDGSTVRHGAYIRGGVIVGERCVVGHATELKNCILLNDAHAAHFAYIGDSVLGNKVNFGAGVKCANVRLDRKAINVHWNGQRIATGLRKFGAIIGDGSQIGCNAVTNPGTILEKGALGLPCEVLSGVVTVRN